MTDDFDAFGLPNFGEPEESDAVSDLNLDLFPNLSMSSEVLEPKSEPDLDLGFDLFGDMDVGEKELKSVSEPKEIPMPDLDMFGDMRLHELQTVIEEPQQVLESSVESIFKTEVESDPFSGWDFDNSEKEATSTPEEKRTTLDSMDLSIFEVIELKKEETEDDLWNDIILNVPEVLYDVDTFEAELPSQSLYCTISQNSKENPKKKEWVDMCIQACPDSVQEMYHMICLWIQAKAKVFQYPKIITSTRAWSLDEIMLNPNVQRELTRCYQLLWKESIEQAEGIETVEWVKSVCVAKILQHLVNFFTVCVR